MILACFQGRGRGCRSPVLSESESLDACKHMHVSDTHTATNGSMCHRSFDIFLLTELKDVVVAVVAVVVVVVVVVSVCRIRRYSRF